MCARMFTQTDTHKKMRCNLCFDVDIFETAMCKGINLCIKFFKMRKKYSHASCSRTYKHTRDQLLGTQVN